MAEYSYNTMLIEVEDLDGNTRQAIEDHILDAIDMPRHSGALPAGDNLVIEVDEAPWGSSMWSDTGVIDWLMALQLPWFMTDGGSWDWGPHHWGWRPGMEVPTSRSCDAYGSVVFTQGEMLEILDSPDPRAAVAGHLGDDPISWLSAAWL